MQIGMIGLGRMGMNMAKRWINAKHEVVVYNRTASKVEDIVKEGAVGTTTLEDFVKKLKGPRIVWLMLPTGQPLEEHLQKLSQLLSAGDIIIDGGNSYYKDDLRHYDELKKKGIRYLDAGVSGGIWGLKLGYCTMVGGDEADFKHLEPLLKDLAPKDGYLYCGKTGAGHFVKMVHNGIEYGMMQAYGEGFEILQASPYKPDPQKVAHLWNQGSVVRSWLLELAAEALAERFHARRRGRLCGRFRRRPMDRHAGRGIGRGRAGDHAFSLSTFYVAPKRRVQQQSAGRVARAIRRTRGRERRLGKTDFRSRRGRIYRGDRTSGRESGGFRQIKMSNVLTSQSITKEQLCLFEQTPESCAIVIFGASGDLAQRKLLPSLYNLFSQKLLPKGFYILGVARTPMDDAAFREKIKTGFPKPADAAQTAEFLDRCHYMHGDYSDAALYERLKQTLTEFDKQHNVGPRRVFYLSTPPAIYAPVITLLGKSNLAKAGPRQQIQLDAGRH